MNEKSNKCNWFQQYDESNEWATSCSNLFEFYEGAPGENGFKFCPYCGKELIQHDFQDNEDEY